MKRLLTLNDLYNYYSSTKKSTHFSASEDNENIVVQINGKLKFKKSEKDTEGLREVYLQACHIDENINGSNIKKSVMTAALPSFSNRPILGYIHIVDGQPEFYGHNMHIDDDGNVVYDEVPIGVIPESCDAKLVYDKDKDKTYVEVKGYIFEEYSKAAEILEREQECSVSVELSIRELSYDAKNKYLDIEDFFFSGVTILGKNDEGEIVRPGMSGSNIKLADFSKENNSMFSENNKLIEVLEKLNTTLSGFSNINSKLEEGGNESVNKFEELLAKYGKTVDDVTFEYENLSDEELEAKFAEVFREDDTDGEGADPEPASEGGEGADESDKTDDENDDTDNNDGDNNDEGEATPEEYSLKCSVTYGETIKEFSISLSEKINAISTLVNETYESDGTWYYVDVFDEEKYVIMQDCWSGRAFKQSYKVKKDSYTLSGDRVEVYSIFVTEDERKALDDMRANYSAISEKLAKYEAEPAKMEVINSESYAKIAETKEFAELRDNHFDLSVEEVSAKADEILLAYAKGGSLNFSAEPEKKKVSTTRLPIQTNANKKSRYGSLKFN